MIRIASVCAVLIVLCAAPARSQQAVTVALSGLVRVVLPNSAPTPWLGDATVVLTPSEPSVADADPAQGSVLATTSIDATGRFALYGLSLSPGAYALTAILEQNGARRTVTITVSAASDKQTIDSTIDVTPPGEVRGQPPKTDPFVKVPVFFATDRKLGPTDASVGPSFLNEAALPRATSYGRAVVTIPRTHQRGSLEGTDMRADLRADKANHIVLESVQLFPSGGALFDDIAASLRQTAGQNPSRRIIVFVHGYRTSFDHAVRVAAQIKYDLKPAEATMVLFSWPSRNTLAGYFDDQSESDKSAGGFKSFLVDLAQRNAGARISVIAHSMGNSVVVRALESIARDGVVRKRFLDHVVMAAPDVPAAEISRNSCAIASLTNGVTLYASNHDQALLAAIAISATQNLLGVRREDPLRAGFAVPPVIALGLETIDASAAVTDFLGHGYFAHDADILADIEGVVAGQQPPRTHLLPLTSYWRFTAKPPGASATQRIDIGRCPAGP